MKNSKKQKILQILLINLLGILNGLLCGILIPLYRMHDFSFPMISQNDIPFLTFMMIFWSTIISLINNLLVVNIIAFILGRTNIKKASYAIVLIISILSSYNTTLILAISDIHAAFELIRLRIPDELWITVPVYFIGFYLIFIRNMGNETVEFKPLENDATRKENFRKRLLINIIAIFSAIICGIAILFVRTGDDFSYSISSTKTYLSDEFITLVILTLIYLVQNIASVNLILFLMTKVKTQLQAFGIIFGCTFLFGYIFAFLFAFGNFSTIQTLIHWTFPEEVWIPLIIYLIGFYFIIIRQLGKRVQLSTNV